MSTVRWAPKVTAVQQVTTVTIGTYDAATTYKVTINGKTVSTVGTGGTNATTATALQALLAASTYPEFEEVTWTVNSNVVTGTAVTAGLPFTLATAVSGGTGTISNSTTTANTGPNNWDNALNWDTGAIPVSTDDVIIEGTSVSILYGIDQNAVTLTSLTVNANFTGQIGLPQYNAGGYYEYRTTNLKISATTVNVGGGPTAGGSSLIRLDLGSNAATVNVFSTGTSSVSGLEPFIFKGTSGSNVVNVNKGTVAVAGFGGETATVATLNVGYVNNQASDAQVRLGAGCTLTTVNQYGGIVVGNSAATTVNEYGGTCTWNAGAVTTANVYGGKLYWNSTGTLGTLNLSGTIDLTQDARGKTITNATLFSKATFNAPDGNVTFSNPFLLSGCGVEDVTLKLGKTYHLQRS